jgi:hypothetical protein
MKPKTLEKKLILNKKTVTSLEKKEMLKVNGGKVDTIVGPYC